MTVFTRARSFAVGIALKAASLVFGPRSPRLFGRFLGSTRVDYERQVRPDTNSIVMAVVGWICRTFPEAPLRVSTRAGTELKPSPDHPMTQLLRRPNPYYSGILLWMATLGDWIITGNSYWIKVRSAAGRVVEIWWVPSYMMEPAYPPDGSAFISHYEYKPDGRAIPIRYEIKDIVHLRYGLDPQNPRKGLSPLASLFREIFTDDEAANFSASLLRNLGVPGLVVIPDEQGATIEPEDAESIKNTMDNRFGSDNRGRTAVLSSKTKVQVLSFSPEQMNLKELRRVPEERITGVLGIAAIVVGMGAGLDRSTFANFAEAREAAYESNIIPTQRLLAEELWVQLLPDFSDTSKTEIDFDLSKVRVLQPDQNALVERYTRSLNAGGMLLNSYLRHIGEDELPAGQGDVLYVPNTITPMKPAELLVTEPPPVDPNVAPAVPPANGKVLIGVGL